MVPHGSKPRQRAPQDAVLSWIFEEFLACREGQMSAEPISLDRCFSESLQPSLPLTWRVPLRSSCDWHR